MTKEVIGKLEQAFALDCTVKEACFFAWIHIDTYYDFLSKNPKYSDIFEALRESPVLLARQSVITNMKKNWELALKYLERKRKNEFTPKTEVDHSGVITQNIVKIWQKPQQ